MVLIDNPIYASVWLPTTRFRPITIRGPISQSGSRLRLYVFPWRVRRYPTNNTLKCARLAACSLYVHPSQLSNMDWSRQLSLIQNAFHSYPTILLHSLYHSLSAFLVCNNVTLFKFNFFNWNLCHFEFCEVFYLYLFTDFIN